MPVNVNEIEPDEKIVEIEMERLREFRNHPFKVKADGQMLQLIESISKYGVIFGFATPQAIYKWQKGTAMPTIDNLVMLAMIFQVKIDDIIVVDVETDLLEILMESA